MSDGILTPQEVAALYKQNDWDFLALTDHRVFGDWRKLSDEHFLIIPGLEVDVNVTGRPMCYHVVAIGAGEEAASVAYRHGTRWEAPEWQDVQTVQKVINELSASGLYPFLCHPVWSRTELSDFVDLEGYLGMEIYNHGCEVENHTGYSTLYWDSLLKRDRKVWGIAVDDAHHRNKDQCGGWVCVKAQTLNRQSIIEALLQGRFYSSNGPTLNDLKLQDGYVSVRCSPVREIHFVSDEPRGRTFIAEPGQSLTEARYQVKGTESYVRVEYVDHRGKVAWTNPLYPKGAGDSARH